MKIFAHTIVENEESFIYFAIVSVIDFVDKIIVFDTGSTDGTVTIINSLLKRYPQKIIFQEFGSVDRYEFSKLRQKMLDKFDCDWILVLDGDEIWLEDSIRKVVEKIKANPKLDAIVVPFYNLIGDLYHFQSSDAGQYKILGKVGHLQIRAINKKIPGLHIEQPYGSEGYYDGTGLPIQQRKNITFLNEPYLHATHLKRSSKEKRFNKFKYELGERFVNFKYPRVLYNIPKEIADPWQKRDWRYILRAAWETPLKKIKRRFN